MGFRVYGSGFYRVSGFGVQDLAFLGLLAVL